MSNAFSRPDQLSPDLRRRILSAADELGYVGPDPTARALARGTTGAVGVLLTDRLGYAFSDEVATDFLSAVANELEPTGLAITLLSGAPGPGSLIPARDIAMDGALVFSCDEDAEATDWLLRRKLPLVFVDQRPRDGRTGVNIDDRGGARAAAQHLIDLGHRRIDVLTSHHGAKPGLVDADAAALAGHTSGERLRGWTEALDAVGIRPRIVQQTPYETAESTRSSALLLLDADEPPTAVLCFSDVVALGVVQAATARGLRVPEDLSVVGFDDGPLASRVTPGLTTVHQDSDVKGRTAAAMLTRRIEAARTGSESTAEHVVLPTELVVRGTTAPPPE